MKVIVAHPSLNRGGGAEKVCLTTVRALLRERFKVRLATLEKTNWHFLEGRFGPLCKPTEEIFLYENMPVRGRLSQSIFTSSFLPFLLFLRLRHRRDVLFNTYGDLGSPIADVSYVNALPIETARFFPESDFSGSFFWRSFAQTYGLSLRILNGISRGDRLLTNSKFIQNALFEHLGIRSQVVYPPVDVGQFRREAVGSERERLVVSVARIRPGKRLSIIPQLAKSVKDARFVLIGLADSASQNTIQSLKSAIAELGVQDRVKLLINQPRRRLVEVLSSSTVFLQTQQLEAFGIAVVEAMAAGCVPVVPRDGGPWFDVLEEKDGEWGYSYGNIEEASKIISMLIERENLRREVSERAMKRATVFDSSVFEQRISNIVKTASSAKIG